MMKKFISSLFILLITISYISLVSAATSHRRAAASNAPLVLAVCGMKEEATIAQSLGANVIPVFTGGRSSQLPALLQTYITSHKNIASVISFGVAGAVDTRLAVADMVIPSEVIDVANGNKVYHTDPTITSIFVSKLAHTGLKVWSGANIAIAGTDTPAYTVQARAELKASSGAIAVDDESQVVARFAAANNLKFAVFRSISDDAKTTLPDAARVPLNPDGSPNYLAIGSSLFHHIGQIGSLIGTGLDAKKAFASLTKASKAVTVAGFMGTAKSEADLDEFDMDEADFDEGELDEMSTPHAHHNKHSKLHRLAADVKVHVSVKN